MVVALLKFVLHKCVFGILPVGVRLWHSFDHSGCTRLPSDEPCSELAFVAAENWSTVCFFTSCRPRACIPSLTRRCIASGLCCCLFLEYWCLLRVYSSLKFLGLHPGCVCVSEVLGSPSWLFRFSSSNLFVTLCSRCILCKRIHNSPQLQAA